MSHFAQNQTTNSQTDAFLSSQVNGKQKTVLIVDGDPVNAAVLSRLMKQNGFITHEATVGDEAVNAIRTFEFDLVLLDISMPGNDGLEVLETIRKKDENMDVPIIMVTSSEESELIVNAFEHGANDYVTKPIDARIILARINMHLKFQESKNALTKSEARYSLVVKGTNDGVWDWDLTTGEIYYSPRWLSMLGVEENSSRSPDVWFDRIHPEDSPRIQSELEKHKAGLTPHFEAEIRMRHNDGNYRWTLCRGLAVRDKNDEPIRIAGSLTDITEGKVADALTGLPNRVLFRERLTRCFSTRQRDQGYQFALLYLDLDNFKVVNDSLGHDAGDRLLVALARRLENSIRDSDSFVSRLGGDEFSILLENIKHESEATKVAERIISSVSSPISIGDNREIFASVSVGISLSSGQFGDVDEMLQAADAAMYRAKEQGKSCHKVFDPCMKKDVSQRLYLESELRHAIDTDSINVHFQPILDLASTKVVGFETLSRWTHPQLGEVAPAEFISVAEECGLIAPLGEAILRNACWQMKKWQAESKLFEDLRLNVNLSSIQIRDPKLTEQISRVLQETELPAKNLRLEITEAAIAQNPSQAASTLDELRNCGISIAIDDFGAGYSSLSYVLQLAPDVVKIDRSFVDKINSSIDKSSLVRAIIALADGLDLDVVAEGIETEAQRRILAALGCKYAQGFYFSRPLTADHLLEFVISQSAPHQAEVL